jgi:predicted ester cyclase
VNEDVVGHVADVTIRGADALRQRLNGLYAIYSEPHFTIEDQIAEGDKVLTRWAFRGTHSGDYMGAKATGKQVTATGMNLFRFANGKIAEAWLNADDLGELQQLGVIQKQPAV